MTTENAAAAPEAEAGEEIDASYKEVGQAKDEVQALNDIAIALACGLQAIADSIKYIGDAIASKGEE